MSVELVALAEQRVLDAANAYATAYDVATSAITATAARRLTVAGEQLRAAVRSWRDVTGYTSDGHGARRG